MLPLACHVRNGYVLALVMATPLFAKGCEEPHSFIAAGQAMPRDRQGWEPLTQAQRRHALKRDLKSGDCAGHNITAHPSRSHDAHHRRDHIVPIMQGTAPSWHHPHDGRHRVGRRVGSP